MKRSMYAGRVREETHRTRNDLERMGWPSS